MSEREVRLDLRTNPWPENMGGLTGQLEFWMTNGGKASNDYARLLYATPIYEQTIAQLTPEPVSFYGPFDGDDSWYDDDFWVGGAWYDEEGDY